MTTGPGGSNPVRNRISESFVLFDEGTKGWLSRSDLKCAVASLIGHKPTKAELHKIFGDASIDEGVLRADFLQCMEALLDWRAGTDDDRIRQIFKAFDVRCAGSISKADLVHVFANSTPHISVDTVNQVFDEIDADGDGRVSCREFINVMKFALPPPEFRST